MSRKAVDLLAWSAGDVWMGTLSETRITLRAVDLDRRLTDIRNCSAAEAGALVTISAVESSTDMHGAWRLDLESGRVEQLVNTRYMATASVSPSADALFYLTESKGGRDDLGLEMLDLVTDLRQTLIRKGVARDCVPSASASGVVAYHTVESEIFTVDRRSGEQVWVGAGRHPAMSMDGSSIILIDGGRLWRWTATSRALEEVTTDPTPSDLASAANISRSFDGSKLVIARPSRTLSRQFAFTLVDTVARTSHQLKVAVTGLRGFCFL